MIIDMLYNNENWVVNWLSQKHGCRKHTDVAVATYILYRNNVSLDYQCYPYIWQSHCKERIAKIGHKSEK